jgi:hypothetical protein
MHPHLLLGLLLVAGGMALPYKSIRILLCMILLAVATAVFAPLFR